MQAARAFCAWAESTQTRDELQDARDARRLLSDLIASAVRLELPAESESTSEDPSPITDEQYKAVFRRFGKLPFNYYSEVFNPLVVPAEEPVVADLADDLADIWRDLKEGLVLFGQNRVVEAEWHWCFNFSAHWGHHATAALYALQTWFNQEGDDRTWEPSN